MRVKCKSRPPGLSEKGEMAMTKDDGSHPNSERTAREQRSDVRPVIWIVVAIVVVVLLLGIILPEVGRQRMNTIVAERSVAVRSEREARIEYLARSLYSYRSESGVYPASIEEWVAFDENVRQMLTPPKDAGGRAYVVDLTALSEGNIGIVIDDPGVDWDLPVGMEFSMGMRRGLGHSGGMLHRLRYSPADDGDVEVHWGHSFDASKPAEGDDAQSSQHEDDQSG